MIEHSSRDEQLGRRSRARSIRPLRMFQQSRDLGPLLDASISDVDFPIKPVPMMPCELVHTNSACKFSCSYPTERQAKACTQPRPYSYDGLLFTQPRACSVAPSPAGHVERAGASFRAKDLALTIRL